MFDIGWTEITVILIIVIIVIGPKELPGVLRTVGIWVGKVKAMTSDFRNQVDEMIEDSELKEVKRQVESVSSFDPRAKLENEIDPNGDLKDAFDFNGEAFDNPISPAKDFSESDTDMIGEDESKDNADDSDLDTQNEELSDQELKKSGKEVQA